MRHVTIVGLFDRREEAERLIGRLQGEFGVSPAATLVHIPGVSDAANTPALRLSSLPDPERALYEEALRRGAMPVSAEVEAGVAGRVMAAFEACGAADLEARVAAWRGEGWTEDAQARDTGYTGHDEDIGFATYGGDAVFRRIPRKHRDDQPAGLLGRFEMAAMPDAPTATRYARCYIVQ